MILSLDDIPQLIESPKNEKAIQSAIKNTIKHRLHIHGVGLDSFIEQVDNYENNDQLELRKKLAYAATRPIFARELRDTKKVYNARGTTRYYRVGRDDLNEDLNEDFRKYLATPIGEGLNIQQWMSQEWDEKIKFDPNGLFFLELPTEQIGERPQPYITYKSIYEIHDIHFTGMRVEYVIFKKETTIDGNKVEQYRVVDDQFDYIFIKQDDEIKEKQDERIVNFWGYVPGIPISNRKDPVEPGVKTTHIEEALGVADEYLTDKTIQIITKKLFAFPTRWIRDRACSKCDGQSKIVRPDYDEERDDLKNKYVPCNACGGTGSGIKLDVSDVYIVGEREGDEPDQLPVTGYESPDKEIFDIQAEELKDLSEQIKETLWGVGDKEQRQIAEAETATKVMFDANKRKQVLNQLRENAEMVEKFLTDAIGFIRYGSQYVGASINYSSKYSIISENKAQDRYQSARKDGASITILDDLMVEWIHSRHENDPVTLDRELKLFELEPFPHISIERLVGLNLDRKEIYMQLNFTKYVERYEREEKSLHLSEIDEVKQKIDQYNSEYIESLSTPEEGQTNQNRE